MDFQRRPVFAEWNERRAYLEAVIMKRDRLIQMRRADFYSMASAFKTGVEEASLSAKEMGIALFVTAVASIGCLFFGWPMVAIVLSILGLATICFMGLYAIAAHLGVIRVHLMNVDAFSAGTFELALDAACTSAGIDDELEGAPSSTMDNGP